MKMIWCAVGPAALLVSACATPNAPRTGEGMVDEQTQVLDVEFVDQSFSLADMYVERLLRPLANSDRRTIDAAMMSALGKAPGAAAETWTNPVTDAAGTVDLVRWDIDRKFGELCGSFEHEARMPERIQGAFILCRARTDPAWDLDEAVWTTPPAPVVARSTPGPGRSSTPGPQRSSTPASSGRAPAPVVDSPPSTAGVRPEEYRPPACATGSGAQALGDCLAAPN